MITALDFDSADKWKHFVHWKHCYYIYMYLHLGTELEVAAPEIANVTKIFSLATNFSNMVARQATTISQFFFFKFSSSWNDWNECRIPIYSSCFHASSFWNSVNKIHLYKTHAVAIHHWTRKACAWCQMCLFSLAQVKKKLWIKACNVEAFSHFSWRSAKLVTPEKHVICAFLAPFSWKYVPPQERKMFDEYKLYTCVGNKIENLGASRPQGFFLKVKLWGL